MITISTPIYGHVPGLASISFAALVATTLQEGKLSSMTHCTHTLVDTARNIIVKQFLPDTGTHLLFVDSDMICPMDAALSLLKRDKDVVGGLYFSKQDKRPIAFQTNPWKQITTYQAGLNRVGCVGMGCTLIRKDVFTRMFQKYNDQFWFNCDKGKGEDVWFCERCEDMGIEVWLDADVKCGHIGEVVITEQEFKAL